MKEVLAKAQELFGVLESRISFNDRVKKDNEAISSYLNARERELKSLELSLSERERAIRPIENIAKAHEEAVLLKSEAGNLLDALNKDKSNFEKSKQAYQDQVNAEKADMAILRAKIDKENILLGKEWEVLNKEKQEYKNNILNEIKNRIG